MSFGKMNTLIAIIETEPLKDSEGFTSKVEHILTTIHAYKEERHGSRKWANMAAYSNASAIFQLRVIPSLQVEPGMLIRCDGTDFKILSVALVRHMYLEIAAEKIQATKG